MTSSFTRMTRREFLKLAGAGMVGLGLSACGAKASSIKAGPASGARDLKILQQVHFVPAYDEWFDKDFVPRWAQANNATVTVDHMPFADLFPRTVSEVVSQGGHDLIGLATPPAALEADVADLSDLAQELEAKAGAITPFVKNCIYNPKTKKYFAISDHWVILVTHWRKDLWEKAAAGSAPNTWEDLLKTGIKLKSAGAPLGLGLSSELDSTIYLNALLMCYGGSIQDESGRVTINSPQTVQAIKMATDLFNKVCPSEVLGWSASSNNQFMLAGKCSLVLNAVSVLRTAEKNNPEMAANLYLSKIPAGPARQLAPANLVNSYIVPNFSPQIDLAKQFLHDLILDYKTAFQKSELYNMPSFPGLVPDLAQAMQNDPKSTPPGKYAFLAEATQWCTNLGYPGTANAAINDVTDAYIIPRMFALAALGDMKAEDAAAWAEREIKVIFSRWQLKGLI